MKSLFQGASLILIMLVGIESFAKPDPLFQDDSILNVVLTAPLTQVYAERKKKERLWMPGQFAYTNKEGIIQRVDVSIRTRGIFRRAECRLPPLRLNFKKKQLKGTLLKGQDKLKLVSPCNANNASQQQLILEYLAYRMYATLTDHALNTRLLRLSYVDSDKRKKPWTHYTFLIEDESKLAKRVSKEVLHTPSINSSQLDDKATALAELFQLMIANNDYSTIRGPSGRDCCHNMELIKPPGSRTNIVPVPYDFDVSGLVNAKYAVPPEKLPIKNVRKRYFRGRCQPADIWPLAIANIQSKREEILSLVTNSSELNENNKNKTLRYLQNFFDILDNPKRVQKEIIGRCRG